MTSYTCVLRQVGGNKSEIVSTAADARGAVSLMQDRAKAEKWQTTRMMVVAIMLEDGAEIARFRSMSWKLATIGLRRVVRDVFIGRKPRMIALLAAMHAAMNAAGKNNR